MLDVAASAGVSLKTVSRVINGEPGVSDELIERVNHAVAELDYRHNLAASNLRRGVRSQTVGVLLHDLRNEFAAALLRAIDDRARPLGIAILASSLDDNQEREQALVRDLVTRRVDGLVLMPASADQSYLESELRAGLAVVAVDRPAHDVEVDTVVVDNAEGARAATAHLVEEGHRRIACLTDRASLWTAQQRRAGYEAAMSAAGAPVDESLIVQDLPTSEAAANAVATLLSMPDPPTAIFAARNELTVGALRALRARGMEREVAMVGFDELPLADLVSPAVSVVAQDVAGLGAATADLLFERMNGLQNEPRTVVIPTRLLIRESSRPVAQTR